ncbi:hypothetical protein PV762_11410 [Mitsuaria sp. CC2]|uniref:hypothetical protein n=1 Tax=Mitsuaria sp. CC2 TaxID=3029186 RepID=UPI003B8B0DC7
MLPPLPLFTFTKTLSTVTRGGDRTVLDPLHHRLTGAGTVVADLRDLGAAMLDELPDGFLRGLMRLSRPPAPRDPLMVALPEGCAAATVNRFLRELPGTECLSAAGIVAQGGPVDLPTDTALRLFETTLPRPFLRNAADAPIPVLFRKTAQACTIVPGAAPDGAPDPAASDVRLAMVTSLRDALCDDDCCLELAPTAAFREMSARLKDTVSDLRARLPAAAPGASGRSLAGAVDSIVRRVVTKGAARAALPGARTGASTGASIGATSPATVTPTSAEKHTLLAALRMTPRELLTAPASIVVQGLLSRLPAEGDATGLDANDLNRVTKLLADQWDIACPVRGSLRPSRLPRDLVTVARLQRWVWPDSAHATAQHVDDERKACQQAARLLRLDWESRRGFDRALKRFAELGVPLPETPLLYRLGVLKAEALAAQQRTRHVSFVDPVARKDPPPGADGADPAP